MKHRTVLVHHQGEQNYLVSVSDLMAGLLFLFIITIMVFALQLVKSSNDLRETERKKAIEVQKKRQEVKKLTITKQARTELLKALVVRLRQHGIIVTIDVKMGVLRLPEQILFRSGSSRFRRGGKQRVKVLASVLAAVLPCYTRKRRARSPCKVNRFEAQLDSIFVEGHTDKIPLGGRYRRYRNNWHLSAARAIEAFRVMVEQEKGLLTLKNAKQQFVFGVSGYASFRPIDPRDTKEAFRKNRRIDLRFIMSPPRVSPEPMVEVRKKLEHINRGK